MRFRSKRVRFCRIPLQCSQKSDVLRSFEQEASVVVDGVPVWRADGCLFDTAGSINIEPVHSRALFGVFHRFLCTTAITCSYEIDDQPMDSPEMQAFKRNPCWNQVTVATPPVVAGPGVDSSSGWDAHVSSCSDGSHPKLQRRRAEYAGFHELADLAPRLEPIELFPPQHVTISTDLDKYACTACEC